MTTEYPDTDTVLIDRLKLVIFYADAFVALKLISLQIMVCGDHYND